MAIFKRSDLVCAVALGATVAFTPAVNATSYSTQIRYELSFAKSDFKNKIRDYRTTYYARDRGSRGSHDNLYALYAVSRFLDHLWVKVNNKQHGKWQCKYSHYHVCQKDVSPS